MPSQITLPDCISLAEWAHRNQRDKAGFPYIEHPKRVLATVQAEGAPPYAQMSAILHDVTEDTDFTPEILLTLGVPEAAVNLVRLLDRELSQNKFFELEHRPTHDSQLFYYWEIRHNPYARQVKLADIGDNSQPWRLSYLDDRTQDRLRRKYTRAVELLTLDERHFNDTVSAR